MRDIVSKADPRVDGAHGIGERTAPRHDQHRPAYGQLGRLRARPPQAGQPIGPQQSAADLDHQRT